MRTPPLRSTIARSTHPDPVGPPLRRRRPRRTRRPARLWLRSPTVHWIVVIALGALTVLSLHRQRAELDRRAARFGSTLTVAVVVADHDTGERLDRDDVELRQVPRRMVAHDALRRAPDGDRLVAGVAAGEVLLRRRLAPAATSPLAASVPPDWRAVAVPLPAGGLGLSAGDRVDLVALGADGASATVVDEALVVAASATSASIAVPRTSVGVVADAILAATLTVALAGPSG